MFRLARPVTSRCIRAPLSVRFSSNIPRATNKNASLGNAQGTAQANARATAQGRAKSNAGKKWALLFAATLAVGTTLYSLGHEKGLPKEFIEEKDNKSQAQGAKSTDDGKKGPAFSSDQVSVIFVLGGPGAGKGTQCAKLVRDYKFVHLSAGDLLRAEQNREGSEFGELIKHYIKEGLIVPQEVTLSLLENAIKENYSNGSTRFLIDGFPRKMDQALSFEKQIVPSKFTLFFECPEQVMLERLLERGKTSGRADDNIASIKKRFRTFEDTSMPVVNYFDNLNKVVKVRCDHPVDVVYKQVQDAIADKNI
ncbi:Uridylate kinase [Nakaseomyces bracarensis]|uniref:Uridylate kinase n=1 Tax=Nakaseomyces bracarensis TaxID=273131 RepID=A0ABR4NXY6_9SACH